MRNRKALVLNQWTAAVVPAESLSTGNAAATSPGAPKQKKRFQNKRTKASKNKCTKERAVYMRLAHLALDFVPQVSVPFPLSPTELGEEATSDLVRANPPLIRREVGKRNAVVVGRIEFVIWLNQAPANSEIWKRQIRCLEINDGPDGHPRNWDALATVGLQFLAGALSRRKTVIFLRELRRNQSSRYPRPKHRKKVAVNQIVSARKS